MPQWFGRTFFIGAVFLSIWLLMVIYWQESNIMPSPVELGLYLLALPAGLLLAVWLVRKGIHISTRQPEARPEQDSSPLDAQAQSEAQRQKQEREWTLLVLASAVRSPHGQSAEELASYLAEGKSSFELDKELSNSEGLPVFTARIADLDENEQEIALNSWLQEQGKPEVSWDAESLRALKSATEAITELSQAAFTHTLLPTFQAAQPSQRDAIPLPTLQLVLAFPAQWDEAQRHTASDWFMHLIEQQGWPRERLQINPLSQAQQATPFSLLDAFNAQSNRMLHPSMALLLAFDSRVGENAVAQLENAGQLLSSKNNNGLVPGEGAAGLLLSNEEQSRLLQLETLAVIHRVSAGRRDKSADASGRISADFLTTLVQGALAVAGFPGEKITALVSDTDHRASRASELMEMANATFPELDLQTQCLKVASACGAAGAVSSLTALALAHHAACSEPESAVLCVSNLDPFERHAVILKPYVEMPAPQQTTHAT